MLHMGHRLSKDVDIFIDDPQYISYLSPRLAGEEAWGTDIYQESANHLKLIYPEGEIDFIVAGEITGLPAESMTIAPDDTVPDAASITVAVEHPVEIALKKLNYRGSFLKVRDIFDIAVVNSAHETLLRDSLHRVSHIKQAIVDRLASIPEDFCRQELAELDILEDWRPIADRCLEQVREIANAIPEIKCTP
jgi:hypothetical protein